ncbi:MAG TPA: hypothetical protein EYG51_22055 [Pseudomonadales bacterium]|nr:hypothetical protein [Pseudomonadales bacterium]
MRLTKQQLRRIIKEEKIKLAEMGPGMMRQTDSDRLGALIEQAIELAMTTRNAVVLASLEDAHDALTGI